METDPLTTAAPRLMQFLNPFFPAVAQKKVFYTGGLCFHSLRPSIKLLPISKKQHFHDS